MKIMLVSFAIALTVLAVQAQTGEKMNGGVEKTIANMEQQWTEAGKTSNAEAVSPMVAEKFVNLDSDGRMIDKSKTLENIRKSKWEINEISDVKVTTFGNTAIATGAWRVDAHERFVDTWTKMPNGKWQCIAMTSAPVKM